MPFSIKNRIVAGRMLANKLGHYQSHENLLVLAIPRGGVPLGKEIATALNAPLDIICVRKLSTEEQPELAFGAIASGGKVVLNQDIITELNISDTLKEVTVAQEKKELLRREQLYRGDKDNIEIKGNTVIVVDDGLATGATMEVALTAIREQQPLSLIVAVAVAPKDTIARLRDLANEVVCLETPQPFYSVGRHYEDFTQLSDQAVIALLND